MDGDKFLKLLGPKDVHDGVDPEEVHHQVLEGPKEHLPAYLVGWVLAVVPRYIQSHVVGRHVHLSDYEADDDQP